MGFISIVCLTVILLKTKKKGHSLTDVILYNYWGNGFCDTVSGLLDFNLTFWDFATLYRRLAIFLAPFVTESPLTVFNVLWYCALQVSIYPTINGLNQKYSPAKDNYLNCALFYFASLFRLACDHGKQLKWPLSFCHGSSLVTCLVPEICMNF